ncbi:MAG: leucyl aminopeptidase family protein [Candidatus Adiutrix sp.]|nr:leucyl aminopeptidase family protein [Candidatus Adiutrix sp.]
MGDEPGNLLYPESFARRAESLAQARGLKTQVLDEKGLARGKFNLLLAVGGGSRRPPRLVTLTYRGARSKAPVVLVGKGLTYDSGGLSLKPPANLAAMHTDMVGAAAVLAVALAATELKWPLNLAAILPLAENMPGGGAYRVGDVHSSRSGRSVEITNTDAEGRLVLAEALTLAGEMKPAAVIDVATLTGACAVALGGNCAGLFANDDRLRADLLAAAEAAGENLWPLPLLDEYEELLESQVADLMNAPAAAQGGAINAALFLRKFVPPGVPWAHLDIAGPARTAKARPGFPVGASGFAVRTLLRHLRRLAGRA